MSSKIVWDTTSAANRLVGVGGTSATVLRNIKWVSILIDQVPVSEPGAQTEDIVCSEETRCDPDAASLVTGSNAGNPCTVQSTEYNVNQHILDSAPDGILITDRNNCIRFRNRAVTTLFALDATNNRNTWANGWLSEACAQLVQSEFNHFWRDGNSTQGLFGDGRKLIAHRHNKTQFPAHVTCRSVLQDGELLIISFVRDISTQVQVEDEFQRQNAHLKASIDYSPIGICMITRTFDLVEANLTFAKMVGHSVDDIVGHKFTEFAHPDDTDKIENVACQNFVDRRDHYTIRCRFLHKSGHTVHAAMTIGLIRDAFGNAEYAIVNVQNQTQRREAQLQLKEQQNQLNRLERLSVLGEMSAGIAHEIDQPLTAISNYAQSAIRFISSDNAKPERAADALRNLSQEAQRAGSVVQRVRDLARGRPGHNKLVDCSVLIDDVAELVRSDARSHQVAVRMVLARDLSKVLGDAVQIQQVVLNLVRNALDASREIATTTTPEIIVRTATKENGDVLVAVSDQGAGVDNAIAEHLFEPFSTTKKTGIGLGLSISQSIVTAHGGQLAFKNNRADGATFYFTLPKAPEH